MAIVSHGRLSDHLDGVVGAISADDTQDTSPFVSVSDFRQVLVHVQSAESTAGGTVTVQMRQADNEDGDNAEDLGDAFELTVDEGDQAAGAFTQYVNKLDDGKTAVAVQLDGLSDAATSAAVFLGEGRYKG